MANVSQFKSQLTQGGARANQFRVALKFPGSVIVGPLAEGRASFLCKAAQIPSSTIEDIPVNYRGRVLHVAGEKTFSPWTVTIYNDGDFLVRNAFEQWSDLIQNNTRTNGALDPTVYQTQMIVSQLDRNEGVVKDYTFVGAYPVEVGAIALDYEAGNQIEQFDVTFVYDYWQAITTVSSDQGGITVTVGL